MAIQNIGQIKKDQIVYGLSTDKKPRSKHYKLYIEYDTGRTYYRESGVWTTANAGGYAQGANVVTAPPMGKMPITNLYWDPATSKLVGEYDDGDGASSVIDSDPPQGKFPVRNLYWDPVINRVIGEYEDNT